MSEARTPITSLDLPASYIGRSVARPNAARLLAGRGIYVDDIRRRASCMSPSCATLMPSRESHAHRRFARARRRRRRLRGDG